WDAWSGRHRWRQHLAGWMFGVDGRKVFDLLLGEVEPYAGVDAGNGINRYRHFFVREQVSLAEEKVSDPMMDRIGQEPLHRADFSIRSMHRVAGAQSQLAAREDVVHYRLRLDQPFPRPVVGCPYEIGVLRRVGRLEGRQVTAEMNPSGRGVEH